jgi:hypothetical protein
MIKAKEGKCADCKNKTRLIAERCQNCYWKNRKKVKESEAKELEPTEEIKEKKVITVSRNKKKYIIPNQSAKRRSQNVLYLKKRRIFMEQYKTCQAKLFNCTILSTDLHHKKGRVGDLLTDERYFLAVCRSCHDYIEAHPIIAKENGFSLNRL